MPHGRLIYVAMCAVVALLGGACGPQQEPSGGAPSGLPATLSPQSSPAPAVTVAGPLPGVDGSELKSTGWQLVGVPLPDDYTSSAWFNGPNAMVADGAGHVWIRSGWQVIRLDAASGESRSWDAGDDAVFASPALTLAPASGSGVWLVTGGRIRLFDGARFVIDVQVPEDVLDVSDATGRIVGTVKDVVQRGSELWVSLDFTGTTTDGSGQFGGQVVRWSVGQWSQMSELEDGIGGDLVVDREGRVWAGGQLSPEGHRQGVRRWDGVRWALPGEGQSSAPPGGSSPAVGAVRADRGGAVWFKDEIDGMGLYRFDGNQWQSWSGLGDYWAVSGDGDAWVIVGDTSGVTSGVTRIPPAGATQAFGPEHGLPEGIVDIEVASGGEVLVMGMKGVLRLSGGRFTQVWQDLAPGFAGALVALSKEEVWPLGIGDSEQFRYDGEAWHGTGLTPSWNCPAVLATDGAVWVPAEEGLVRQADDRRVVVATRIDGCEDMRAGRQGSMWLPGDKAVTNYAPDGTRTSIPWPGLTDHECLKAAGADGSVWVSAETEPGESVCDDRRNLARWDGRRWTPIDAPPTEYLGPMVVTDDGAAWMATGYAVDFFGRYADGRWTMFDAGWFGALTAVPGGRVCGMVGTDPSGVQTGPSFSDAIICYDANGEFARFDLQGMGVSAFSVAPDGTIWVLGSQIARIAERLPMN